MPADDPAPVPQPAPRPNKRLSRRLGVKRSTRAQAFRNALGLGPNIALTVLDVSESGVRLQLKEELPVGREFELNLESPGGKPFKVEARVMWVVAAADGTFVVGARFAKLLPYAELTSLSRT